jgi:hypothetical protein
MPTYETQRSAVAFIVGLMLYQMPFFLMVMRATIKCWSLVKRIYRCIQFVSETELVGGRTVWSGLHAFLSVGF